MLIFDITFCFCLIAFGVFFPSLAPFSHVWRFVALIWRFFLQKYGAFVQKYGAFSP